MSAFFDTGAAAAPDGSGLVLLHLVATAYMTGLIWFVQLAHYPLLADVGEPSFRRYQQHNLARTTWAVLPVMVAELLLAVALSIWPPPERAAMAWLGLGLAVAIWLSTFVLQVPCHTRLQSGFDARAWRRLVGSNWLRTVLWTARTVVATSLSW